jgi:hypothetical protein
MERVLLGLLVVAVLTYAADWIVWRVKLARGAGYSTVQVDQYLGTALKGNKEEYDYLGTAQQSCAVALFPHGGSQPCWWLRRHTSVWE